MEGFILVNQRALFTKLDTVRKIDKLYNCNDIIEILSESKARDMRLINDYDISEVVIKKVFINTQTRRLRYFTLLGIAKYLHEGKIYSYANACAYFSVQPINKEHAKWKKTVDSYVVDGLFATGNILKWLFEKKKSCMALDNYISIDKLKVYLDSTNGYNEERAKWLLLNY
jgi:hypothetical protein